MSLDSAGIFKLKFQAGDKFSRRYFRSGGAETLENSAWMEPTPSVGWNMRAKPLEQHDIGVQRFMIQERSVVDPRLLSR